MFHVPPRKSGVLANLVTAPPSRSIRLRNPLAPNPIERLSGDQKGKSGVSVPCNGWASVAFR